MTLHTMRVLIVNTSENMGGAAVAAGRLVDALNNNGVKAKMMVRDKATDSLTVASVGGRLRSKWAFLWERWCVFCHLGFSRKRLFSVDIANAGIDITRTREFKEADIVHLHWVNQGMLSLHGIGKILDSGKPVVWTMHDMWGVLAVPVVAVNRYLWRHGPARMAAQAEAAAAARRFLVRSVQPLAGLRGEA